MSGDGDDTSATLNDGVDGAATDLETKEPDVNTLPLEERVSYATENFSSSKLATREAAFKNLVSSLEDDEATQSIKTALLDVIFQTIYIYKDKHSHKIVENAIATLSKCNKHEFVKSFVFRHEKRAFAVSKIQSAAQTPRNSEILVLIKWASILILNAFETLRSENLFGTVVSAQCALLDLAIKLKPAQNKAAFQSFKSMIAPSSIQEAYAKQVTESSSSKYVALALISSSCNQNTLNTYKPKFLDGYIQGVLSLASKLPVEYLKEYNRLLKSLSVQEYTETLHPAVNRILKRTPEISMHFVQHLYSIISLDLSTLAAELMTSFQPHLKSTDEALRAASVKSIGYVGNLTKDNSAFEALALQSLSLLDGAPLPYPYQRQTIFSAIVELSRNSERLADKQATITKIVAKLAASIDSETNDDVKVIASNALSGFLKYQVTPSPEIIKFFWTGLKSDKDLVRQGRLHCFATSLESSPALVKTILEGGSNDFVSTLLQLAKNSFQATAKRIDLISSLRALLVLTASDSNIESRIESEKIWQSFFDANNFLFTQNFLDRVSESDLLAVIALYEDLIKYQNSKLASALQSNQQVLLPVVYLLLRKDKSIRSVSANSIHSLHQISSELSQQLLETWNVNRDCAFVKSASSLNIAFALRASVSTTLSQNSAALLLFLSHHFSADGSNSIWKRVLNKTKWNEKEVLSQQAENIAKFFASENGLASLDASVRNTAINALRTVASTEAGLKEVISSINQQLRKLKEEEPNETQLAIYHTPEGELYTTISVKSDKDKNERQGKKGMYSKADNKWEQEVRSEMNKKKGDAASKEEQAARAEMLAKESEIRKNVGAWITTIETICSALRSMAKTNPTQVHNELFIFSTIFKFITSPLVDSYIVDCIEALIKCSAVILPSSEKQQRCFTWSDSRKLAVLLLRLYGNEKRKKEVHKFQLQETGGSMLERLNAVSLRSGVKFTHQSLTTIFPLLKAAIFQGFAFTMQEIALSIIEAHTANQDIFDELRKDITSTLLYIIETAPRFESRAETALIDLAEGYRSISDLAELEDGILHAQKQVRKASLSALENVPLLSSYSAPEDAVLESRIWFARSDSETENATIASGLWRMYNHALSNESVALLYPILSNEDTTIRRIAGSAIAASAIEISRRTGDLNSILAESINQLKEIYKKTSPVKTDKGGPQFFQREDREDVDETWATRSGIAFAFEALAPVVSEPKLLQDIFNFMIAFTLGDKDDQVRQEMVTAGMEILNEQGKENVNLLIPIFEKYLDQPAGQTLAADRTRESVVMFLGGLAKHIQDKPKVLQIANKLIETLKTPSEVVQKAVATYLSQLVPLVKEDAPKLVELLLDRTTKAPSYAERRGAAYGLAGCVKGLGLSSLKALGIMRYLQKAVENKKHIITRQGALFAFECLSNLLGRLFEPYVIHLLEQLLKCFGDASAEVREATTDASKAIMGQLSAHGVKLVLPALLKALDDKSWRTKMAAVELLGSMAFCAPRQLSSCLPAIVPRLATVLDDTSDKVQEAAKAALGHIGSVIRNPEIQSHVSIIIKALDDPETFANEALDALLQTNFVHVIDAPSLALIMPILQRGLREQTEIKKKAAQIIGNMASLSDHKDLIPYLSSLLPSLKIVLLDPIPEVRAMAAKALGCMVRGMGEDEFTDLIPWLLNTMKSDIGSVERSGAAQGLSEVLSGLDSERFEVVLPEIIANTNHKKYYVREGYLTLFTFLPHTMGKRLQPYINKILPSILQGLADEEAEEVREISLQAGQAVVNEYASASLDLLLSALEDGLFHDNWRIRQSSVSLLRDLLSSIAGGTAEDDSNVQGKAIMKALGEERRNRVLAALYMVRSDVNPVVRQKSLLVWKSVVTNTPKTLREILPDLLSKLLNCLGSSNPDKQLVGGRTLGDLVAKLGERVLPSIIPILESGLETKDEGRRQGVCLGLSNVIKAAGEHGLISFVDDMLPAIRKALCDPLEDVREAAAEAFDELFKHLGSKAVNAILPPLLECLEDPEQAPYALEGLKQIVNVRSKIVMPLLVPKLTRPPFTAFNAQALASIAQVAGKSLYYHFSAILPPLIVAMLADSKLRVPAESIVLAVKEEGVHIFLLEIFALLKSDDPTMRVGAANLLTFFANGTKLILERKNIIDMIQSLLPLLSDPQGAEVQKAGNEALDAVIKYIKKDEQANYIIEVRQLLLQNTEKFRQFKENLPAFCLPKGIQSVLPFFLTGLMTGANDVREQSALALGEVLELTPPDAVKPNVAQITGPLIRIIVDKFPSAVKSAILKTLHIVLDKGGVSLKPFLPPLQTTFVKALNDPSPSVRYNAALALGKLMSMSPRVDPLISELLGGFNSTDSGVQESMIRALQSVLSQVGSTASQKALSQVVNALYTLINDESASDEVRRAAGECVGVYAMHATDDFAGFVKNQLLQTSSSWNTRVGAALALSSSLKRASTKLQPFVNEIYDQITKVYLADEKQPVKQAGAECVGHFIPAIGNIEQHKSLLQQLVPLLLNTEITNDTKLSILRVLKNISKSNLSQDSRVSFAVLLVPSLLERLKDRSSLPLKLAAERALFHILQAKKSDILQEVTQSLDPTTSRSITDYHKRVLSKLPEQSDDDVVSQD